MSGGLERRTLTSVGEQTSRRSEISSDAPRHVTVYLEAKGRKKEERDGGTPRNILISYSLQTCVRFKVTMMWRVQSALSRSPEVFFNLASASVLSSTDRSTGHAAAWRSRPPTQCALVNTSTYASRCRCPKCRPHRLLPAVNLKQVCNYVTPAIPCFSL